jgi:hypothetical protein
MRQIVAVLTVVVLALACGGCGSGDGSPAPKTPGDLIGELNRAAFLGQPEAMVALMDTDAQSQKGRQWLAHIARVAHPQAVAALQDMAPEAVRKLEPMDTAEFVEALHANAPMALQRMFAVHVMFDYEEGDRVLVYANNEQGQPVWFAMRREANGTLKLVGEDQTRRTYDALAKKLEAAFAEHRKGPAGQP